MLGKKQFIYNMISFWKYPSNFFFIPCMPGMGLGFCCCCLLACLFVLKERDRSSSFFVATHRKYCQKHNNFPYDYFSYFSQNIFPRLTFVRFSHEEGAGQHSKRRIKHTQCASVFPWKWLILQLPEIPCLWVSSCYKYYFPQATEDSLESDLAATNQ